MAIFFNRKNLGRPLRDGDRQGAQTGADFQNDIFGSNPGTCYDPLGNIRIGKEILPHSFSGSQIPCLEEDTW
jgi:hypothetical protein